MGDDWIKFNAKTTTHQNMVVKYCDQNQFNRIEFIVTDVKKLWHQYVLYSELKEICEISSEKNTFLEIFLKAVKSEDSELHFTEPNNSATLAKNESVSNLELIAYFEGLATSFKFKMTEVSDGVYKHITAPLLLLVQHAKDEREFLLKQIKAREEEIQEWRATNATITRTMLLTVPFSELYKRVPVAVSENMSETIGNLLCLASEYKDNCGLPKERNLFDILIETEVPMDSKIATEHAEETGPTENKEVPKREIKDEVEASTSSGHKKPKVEKVESIKVKQEKSENSNSTILTAVAKGQASKKVKAKKMVI